MANYDLTYEGSEVQGILNTGNSLKDAGYIFRGEATPSTVPGTPTERVAYIGGPGTYTNFGDSITVPAGCVCIFKYTGSAWTNQVIDAQGASEGIFDLSAYNAQGGTLATYADLSAALTALNALPSDFKKGGMSMKYVQTSDNKYVQYFCNANSFTTNTLYWVNYEEELNQLNKEIIDGVCISQYKSQFTMISDYGGSEKICYNVNNNFVGITCDGVLLNAKVDGKIDICKINTSTKAYTIIESSVHVNAGWNVYIKKIELGENETIGIIGSLSYANIPDVNGFVDYNITTGTTQSFAYVIGALPFTFTEQYVNEVYQDLYNKIVFSLKLGGGLDFVDKSFTRAGVYSMQSGCISYNTDVRYLGLMWHGMVVYSETDGFIEIYKVNTTNRNWELLRQENVVIGENILLFDYQCGANETLGIRSAANVQYGTGDYPGFIEYFADTKEIRYNHPTYILGYFPIAVVSVENFEIEWSIPRRIYAVVGQEKSIYLDNIVNRNDDAPEYVIEVNKTFGSVDSRRFYFTPDATGTKTIELVAYQGNVAIDTRTITIEVLPNTLANQKVICCVGDSITEERNMPYYIQQAFQSVLTQQSVQPTFVGTKGGESGMGHKPTYHEGYFGRSYQWIATENTSPFWNPNVNHIDIAYYRAQNSIPQIDVVSLAMGFNRTATKADADEAFSALQTLIAAFKADNANTKFVVHLVTYPAMGNVLQENQEMRISKKNSLHYFRSLCENAYNNNQDVNIIIGDLGLVYDRWFAYVRQTVHPAAVYVDDTIQVVTDRVHPSEQGCEQMGSGIMACILKMCQ